MAKLLIPQNSGFDKSDGPGRGARQKPGRIDTGNRLPSFASTLTHNLIGRAREGPGARQNFGPLLA
jgi:hypothetical protein